MSQNTSLNLCIFQLMKLGQTVLGKNLFGLIMKLTFYGQFVAGEVIVHDMRILITIRSCFVGYSQDCSSHRQNEELRSEVYLGLQCGGGHHQGGG